MDATRCATLAKNPPPAAPLLCIVGETLRQIVVLSEAEWDALLPGRRPSPAEYFPGMGWVCAGRPHPE